jgi:glutathione S-transferase
MSNITLHEYAASGNCYKLRLIMAHLGRTYTRREYDILKGETRTPEFLVNVNANGRIPVLEVDGKFLPESNAALWYLAEGSGYIPEDKYLRAQVLQWMFFEQYNHEPNIATVRYWLTYGGGMDKLNDWQRQTVPVKVAQGYAALDVMEKQLSAQDFLVSGGYTIADIALYAYTHVAGDGGFDLSRYPAINRWMARVQAQKGHVTITA